MKQTLAAITYVVRDYDEAIDFFVESLGFDLIEDICLEKKQPGKWWVIVRPRGSAGCSLLLAKAVGSEQSAAVGNQSGGRVFLFLHTDDFHRDYREMKAKGIGFCRPSQTGRVWNRGGIPGFVWQSMGPDPTFKQAVLVKLRIQATMDRY